MLTITFFLISVAVAAALPAHEHVIRKLESGLRYQYVRDGDSTPHLVDTWMKTSDVAASRYYDPDRENIYHLFTRANPSVSQPLLPGNSALLSASNFDGNKRTIILVSGWRTNPSSPFNNVLVPAFLTAADVNVVVVDWSAGASTINYATAVINAIVSGEAIARFINWVNAETGSTVAQYHLAGHNFGGHTVGVIGRNLGGAVPYISSIDPSGPGWMSNIERFHADDGIYTEVIHTSSGAIGYLPTLGKVDFYPNGGSDMPGCNGHSCDHERSYHYFGESIVSDGFTGRRCLSYLTAIAGTCAMPGTLRMGGLEPKTGATGIYHLLTNAAPPFSQG